MRQQRSFHTMKQLVKCCWLNSVEWQLHVRISGCGCHNINLGSRKVMIDRQIHVKHHAHAEKMKSKFMSTAM